MTFAFTPEAIKSTSGLSFAAMISFLFIRMVRSVWKQEGSGNSDNRASRTTESKSHLLESLSYLALVLGSHFICYYLWWAAEFNQGAMGSPFPLTANVLQKARPNATSIRTYFGLLLSTLFCSRVLPGPTVLGFKIPQENNRRLAYKCNALANWYLMMAFQGILQLTGIFDIRALARNSGALLSTAVLFADTCAVLLYLECVRSGRSDGSFESFLNDFVMGRYLNPRIGPIDIKLWAEIRVSWMLLFALDVSAALCLRDEIGYIPKRLFLVLLNQGLYTNACMKGEESIPYTWDISTEKFGWMLIFWNLAGVAMTYTFNGRYICARGAALPDLSNWSFAAMATAVLLAYGVFDEANAQKNRFRAREMTGSYVERKWAFPQMPHATIVSPRFLTTQRGPKLLIDGWWKIVRKPNYSADIALAVLLCLPCGFDHFLPWFFTCFFVPMLVHRAHRDNARCSQKYGDEWAVYCRAVPYILIPGVY